MSAGSTEDAGVPKNIYFRYRLVPEPRVEFISAASSQITGYTPEDHYKDPELAYRMVWPEDRPLLDDVIRHPKPGPSHLTLRWQKKGGGIVRTDILNTPVFDAEGRVVALEGVARDITDEPEPPKPAKHRQERRYAASQVRQVRESVEQRFHSLLQYTSEILLLLDPSGLIHYTSPSALRMLGYPLKELNGKRIPEIQHSEDRDAAQAAMSECLAAAGRTVTFQCRMLHKDGSWRWMETLRQNLLHEPAIQAVVDTCRDVTDRKLAEEELRQSNLRLADALEDLRRTQQQMIQQERLRALGQMASGIAHDFNNCLVPIIGFTDLLLTQPALLEDNGKVAHYLRLIHTAAGDAASIIQRLRQFYRTRQEDDPIYPIDLNELVEQTLSLTEPRWRNQAGLGGTLDIRTDLGPLPTLPGNESDIREILTNLIFNSLDAMPDGGTLTLRTWAGEDAVFLQVEDSGIGMTTETMQKCINPFYSTKGAKGTGLGLTIIKAIIERQEGMMSIGSEPGKGTSIVLRFPLETRRKGPAEDANAGPSPEGLNVLVVDDEPMVREFLGGYLLSKGHTFRAATNGAEALDIYRKEAFDLVLTDRSMPEMGGDQLALTLRELNPSQAIIMLTGFGEVMAAQGQVPPGVDMILGKPVQIRQLDQALSGLTYLIRRFRIEEPASDDFREQ